MRRFLPILALLLAGCQAEGPPKLEPVGAARVEALRADCVKRGGTFTAGGAAGTLGCVTTPRDAGRQCTRATQCESACLARSGSCAPLQPLFGCNEVFGADGNRVTQCIE